MRQQMDHGKLHIVCFQRKWAISHSKLVKCRKSSGQWSVISGQFLDIGVIG